MRSAKSFETRRGAISIPVTAHVRLTDGWGGERWDVCSVVDERTAQTLGDIGVHEFSAYSNFPDTLINAVVKTLKEAGLLQPEVLYSVEMSILDGGDEIGFATSRFRTPLRSEED